jgi:hypothetical protein
LRLAQISIRRVGMRLSKLSWRCRRPDRPVVDYSCGHLARIFMHPNPAWRMRASAAYCAQFRRYAVVLRRRCFLDGTLSSDPWRSVAGRLRRPGSGSRSGCRAGLRPAGKPLAWLVHQAVAWLGTVVVAGVNAGIEPSAAAGSATGVAVTRAYAAGCTGPWKFIRQADAVGGYFP